MIECPGFHCKCSDQQCPNPHDRNCVKHSGYKTLKCSIKLFPSTEFGPVYEIYINEPVKVGAIIRFDPNSGTITISNNRGATTES